MEIVHTHGAGLDVHKKTVVAAIIVPGPKPSGYQETRTFSTMTADLLTLSDWLLAHGVTHVAMESTGEYWKPVFNLLESDFQVLLVNAAHIKAVPGRKTDVNDAEWIADLLKHGLLKASFVPPLGQRELRDLTRHRSTFVRERVNVANRVQKVLESANIKLASVATDVLGVSGRAMLEALITGQASPTEMAELAKGRLREKREPLAKALAGRVQVVWSKNSCGFARVVFQEPPKPFTTPNRAFTRWVLADRRKEPHVALALMIALVMKMLHILRQRVAERRLSIQD
jgi:transposase